MRRELAILMSIIISITFFASGSWGKEHLVSTSLELQNALTEAEENREDDIIKIAQGTYSGNFSFWSTRGDSITLLGGYTADFSARVVNPSNTILDGGGIDTVTSIANTTNGGNVHIEGLTIRNGHYSGDRSRSGGLEVSSWSETDSAGYIKIIKNIITGNTSNKNGGGAFVYNDSGPSYQQGDVIFENNIIKGNTAGFHGGGIYVYYVEDTGPAGNIIFKDNIVMDNNATNYSAGGIMIHISYTGDPKVDPHVLITNNFIVKNTAGAYAGGCMIGGHPTSSSIITNNTISENAASGSFDHGGGLYISGEDNIGLYNNIIWGNTAVVSGADIYLEGSIIANGYNNNYSDMEGSWTNSGDNIDANPHFYNPNGDDYRLRSYSPCIDAGINTAPALPTADYDGDERVLDGNKDGIATVDIGADEYVWMPMAMPWMPPLLLDY